MQKIKVTPQVGDELIFGKYLTGFNRRGQPVYTDAREKTSDKITGVYEDGKVRSSTGDMFEVELRKESRTIKTKTGIISKPSSWVTVA